MAGVVDSDGRVHAPLNIDAPAPVINLRGFNWRTVDEKIHGALAEHAAAGGVQALHAQVPISKAVTSPAAAIPPAALAAASISPPAVLPAQLAGQLGLAVTKPPQPPPEYPLAQFQGPYAGNGFNMIFRPRPNGDQSVPGNPQGPDDNILELNLTLEQLTFGPTIGKIPNRGFLDQQDITLAGLPYLQTVQDVTNPATGKGDNLEPTDIHFEPGMWLSVPATNNCAASVVRMASIPHGTTIQAQGLTPKKQTTVRGGNPGGPVINDIDTTPFRLGDPSQIRLVGTFPSMDATNQHTFRIPQDLSKFNENGIITTDIIKNPHIILKNAIKGQTITETTTLEIFTGPPTSTLNGGGTSNIAFLAGKQTPININSNPGPKDNPIAHADFMRAKYWIESVAYQVNVPTITQQTTLLLKPTMPAGSTAPTPVFAITTPAGGTAAKTITITGIQIQTSQIVNLNFGPPGFVLTWPHVSVSTLVPSNPQAFQM